MVAAVCCLRARAPCNYSRWQSVKQSANSIWQCLKYIVAFNHQVRRQRGFERVITKIDFNVQPSIRSAHFERALYMFCRRHIERFISRDSWRRAWDAVDNLVHIDVSTDVSKLLMFWTDYDSAANWRLDYQACLRVDLSCTQTIVTSGQYRQIRFIWSSYWVQEL